GSVVSMNLTVAPSSFCAACTPSQADWLKLLSSTLPTSVTRPIRNVPPAAPWAAAAAVGVAAGGGGAAAAVAGAAAGLGGGPAVVGVGAAVVGEGGAVGGALGGVAAGAAGAVVGAAAAGAAVGDAAGADEHAATRLIPARAIPPRRKPRLVIGDRDDERTDDS